MRISTIDDAAEHEITLCSIDLSLVGHVLGPDDAGATEDDYGRVLTIDDLLDMRSGLDGLGDLDGAPGAAADEADDAEVRAALLAWMDAHPELGEVYLIFRAAEEAASEPT